MNNLVKNNFFTDFLDFNDIFPQMPEQKMVKDGKYQITIDVPGFNESNLTVEMEPNVLTIQGKTDVRKYYKQFSLHSSVNDIEASISDGVLTLILLLNEKREKIKKIEFK